MIKKFAKILPYCLVMYLVKKFSPSIIKFNHDNAVAWRIDKGEFIVWNQPNYDRMIENQRKSEELDKELEKAEKRKQYEELKREFEVVRQDPTCGVCEEE